MEPEVEVSVQVARQSVTVIECPQLGMLEELLSIWDEDCGCDDGCSSVALSVVVGLCVLVVFSGFLVFGEGPGPPPPPVLWLPPPGGGQPLPTHCLGPVPPELPPGLQVAPQLLQKSIHFEPNPPPPLMPEQPTRHTSGGVGPV